MFLHNWFLVGIAEKRTNNVSNDSTAQVSLGGFTTPDLRDKIQTAPVKSRIEKQLLRTVDGMEVRLVGFIDRDTSYHNGFSIEVINLFYAGFPLTWNHVIDLKTQQHLPGSSHTEIPERLNRQVDGKNNMEDAFLHRDGKNNIQETEEETCQNAELPQGDKGLVTASPKCMADHKLNDVTRGVGTYFTRSKMIKGNKAHSNRKRKRTSPLSSSLLSRNPGEDDINHTSSELNFDNCERTGCPTKSKENGNSQSHVHEFSLMLHPPVEEKLLIKDRVDDSSGRFFAEGLDNNISSQGNNTAINTDRNIVCLPCQNNLFIDSSSFGEAAASSNHNLRTLDQRFSFSLDTPVRNKSHLEKHKTHTVEGEEKKLQTPTKRQESLIPPSLPSRVKRTNQEVSKAFGLKTSKSGRLIVPPLAHWRSQRIMHDMI